MLPGYQLAALLPHHRAAFAIVILRWWHGLDTGLSGLRTTTQRLSQQQHACARKQGQEQRRRCQNGRTTWSREDKGKCRGAPQEGGRGQGRLAKRVKRWSQAAEGCDGEAAGASRGAGVRAHQLAGAVLQLSCAASTRAASPSQPLLNCCIHACMHHSSNCTQPCGVMPSSDVLLTPCMHARNRRCC